MVWRKYEGEGGWYGPGLHLAKSKNNRSHWVNMGARLWKCSREQMRLATDEESLSKEVAMAYPEMLDDVESGRAARYVDVTSDGGPPADELLGGLVPLAPEPPPAASGPAGPAVPAEDPEPERSAASTPAPSTPRPTSSASRLAEISDHEPLIRLVPQPTAPRVRP